MTLGYMIDVAYFFIIPSLIIALVCRCVFKRPGFITIFLTGMAYCIFFISAIKCVLGESDLTIIESFRENERQTYVHYAIPLFSLILFVLFCVRYIKPIREKHFERSYYMIVMEYCFAIIQFMVHGKITNLFLCMGGISGIILMFFYENEQKICTEKARFIKSMKKMVPVYMLWAVLVFVFIPNRLYLTNLSDFNISYTYYIITLSSFAIFFVIVASLSTSLIVPESISDILAYTIFVYTIMGYIQDNFLNGTMIKMDDRRQIWETSVLSSNLVVWIVVIAVILSGCFVFRKKSVKVISIASVYLTAILIFTAVFLRLTTRITDSTDILSTDGMFDLSPKENTIVFILDWYDEQIMEEIVDNEPDFLSLLEGFIWYKNQTSRYAYTSLSMPYLLTGEKWDGNESDEEYVNRAFLKSDFLKDIDANGYSIGIYTDPGYVSNVKGLISNYSTSRGKCKFWKTIEVMSKCSRYQITPFMFKNAFFYSSGKISELSLDGYIVGNRGFYEALLADGLTMNSAYKGAFKLYHLMGVHSMEINEDIEEENSSTYSCGIGSMKIVYEYIDRLKRLGLYDNTEIVITADHGQNYLNEPEQRKNRGLKKNTSNPILFIKKRNAHGALKESLAPVSHDEFCATIIESLGGNTDKYGMTYDDVGDDESRIREFEYYREGDVPYQKYYIDGIATDIHSWKKSD